MKLAPSLSLLSICAFAGCESTPPVKPVAEVHSEPTQAAKPAPKQLPFATANVARVSFAEEGSDFDPCISPDGQFLVFASTQHRNTSDIYSKATNSRVVTQLTSDPADDVMPVISPDGQRIAFASNRSGNWDIYVMPANGGKAVQITTDAADELAPSWSPSGTELVFCRMGQSTGRWEMWVVNAASPASSNFIGYGLFPKWCPASGTGESGSDRILYQLGRERGKRTFGIWTLDYNSGSASNQTEIASSATSALINPAWSPDGHWIAYSEVLVQSELESKTEASSIEIAAKSFGSPSSIWMVNVDGTGKVMLASGMGSSLMPTWGPGNKLYFVSNRNGSDNIWSLDLGQAMLAAGWTKTQTPTFTGVPEEAESDGGR